MTRLARDTGAVGLPVRNRLTMNLVVVAIRLLSVLTGLAYVKSYASTMSAAEIGLFFYLSTLSYAINALVFVPFDFYLQARLVAVDPVPLRPLSRLAALALGVGGIACLLLGAPLVLLGKLRAIDLPMLYALAALVWLCMSLRNLLNNRGDTVFVSCMLLAEALGRLVAFVSIETVAGASARGLLVSSIVALSMEAIIIVMRLRRRLRWGSAASRLDDPAAILRVTAPIAGSAVCNAVQLQAFRIAYPLAGLGATSGSYGVVANIGQQAMAACGSIFAQIELPRLYASKGATSSRYALHATLLGIAVLVLMTALAPRLVLLLTKADYLPYAYAIGFGVVIEGCNLVIGGYAVLLSLQRRTGVLLKLNLLASGVAVIGGVVGMRFRPDDPFAIGMAVTASQLLVAGALVIVVSTSSSRKL